jgi:hypothetical protein
MASFCTKCGTAITGDNAFCTSCGAPVGASAAASPAAPPSNAPVYAAAPVTVAPVRSGSSAVKIILIIVAVFVGLGLLSVVGIMFGIWRVSRAVHISQNNGGAVTVSTPGGSFSAGNTNVSASDLGVDIYPGATQQQGAVRVSTPNGSAVTAAYVTTDPMDKVLDFYKQKLGSGASVYQSDKGAVLSLTDENKKTSIMVTISAESSGTKVAIMHSTTRT